MTPSLNKIIGNVFQILTKEEKQCMFFSLLFNTLVSIVDVASMVILVVVVTFYSDRQLQYTAYLPSWLLQKESLYLFMLFLFFMVVKNWTALLAGRLQYKFVYSVALRISKENLEQNLNGSYEKYVKIDSSVSIRKISYQPIEFSQYILAGMQQIIIESVLILIAITVIIFYDAKLFIILFFLLLPLILVVSYLVKRKLKSVKNYIKSSNEKSLQYLQEALTGFVDVNIYNGKKFFIDRFYIEQKKLGQYLPDLQVSQQMSSRLMEIFAITGLFFLFLANQYLGKPHNAVILNIGAFVAAAYKIIPGVIKILNLSEQMKTFGFTAADLVQEQSEKNVKIDLALQPIKSITLSGITYSYNNKIILNNYSIDILSGDFVGISGPSGIGKTTFINLLLGFLEEEKGQIFINGQCITAQERQQHWQNISYVKQQNFLINDTIQNNICFDATIIDHDRLSEAITASNLYDFIHDFPEGLQRVIAENGRNISGGQRQRIAIARALYKKADVYILDEPFNELDEKTEISLLNYFAKLTDLGCIVILITHNAKSLDYCNKIIALIAPEVLKDI